MKLKKWNKYIVSLLLAVTMMAMPVGAAILNSGNTIEAFAEEPENLEQGTEPKVEGQTDDPVEIIVGEDSEEPKPEEPKSEEPKEEPGAGAENGGGTVSGNEPTNPEEPPTPPTPEEPVYEEPNVKISIQTPNGWYKTKAEISFSVIDTKETGNFVIQSVEVKIGQNGSWIDVTDEMKLELSENCSVYVQVTDTNGKTYAKNKYIECFDTVKPSLNAAINDGLLSIQATDNDSGVAKVFVNGYEFTELTNGALNIRLQQFDSGYQYFTLQASDKAGNLSDVYKMSNPYYEDPKVEKDSTQPSPSSQLPVSAVPTQPTDAKATVTEHTSTPSRQESNDSGEADKEETVSENAEGGKEFYTITTKTDKVFYLIIDKDQTENNVYLLTEVGANDLLNFTESEAEVLPQNSAVVEDALPNTTSSDTVSDDTLVTETPTEGETEEVTEAEVTEPEKSSNAGTYLIMIIALIFVGGGYYYIKFVKGKKEAFDDEDEFDEEEEESDEEEASAEVSEEDTDETEDYEDEEY